jgi:hypothetical protein
LVDINFFAFDFLFVPFAVVSLVAYMIYLRSHVINIRERGFELTVRKIQLRRLNRESFRLFSLSMASAYILLILYWIGGFSAIPSIPIEGVLIGYGVVLGAMINRLSDILRLRYAIRRRRKPRTSRVGLESKLSRVFS